MERNLVDYLTWLRSRVGHSLIPLVSATAMVRDDCGRILFQRRADFDCWGLPGGVLEPGESPAGCVQREVLEETGLQVDPVRLTAALSSPRHSVVYPNGDRVQQITFFFDCRPTGGSLHAGPGESTAVDFFPAEKTPPTLPWYQLALDRSSSGGAYFDPPDPTTAAVIPVLPTWVALRRQTGPEALVLPGASAIIREESGGVLLVRRRDSGQWILPGGLLELGESLSDSVIRETREETGLEVRPMRVCGVFGGHRVSYPNGEILYPIATWFSCEACPGALIPDGEEVDRAEYFPTDRLPPLVAGLEERFRKVLHAPESTVFN
jgi:8-oxo-dGTP diphosphatase